MRVVDGDVGGRQRIRRGDQRCEEGQTAPKGQRSMPTTRDSGKSEMYTVKVHCEKRKRKKVKKAERRAKGRETRDRCSPIGTRAGCLKFQSR